MNTTKMYAKGLLMMASLGLMVSCYQEKKESKNTDSLKDYSDTQTIHSNEQGYKDYPTTQTIPSNEPRYKEYNHEGKGIPKGKYIVMALYVANKDYDVLVSDVSISDRFISEDEKYQLLDEYEAEQREYEPDIITSGRKLLVFNTYAEASKARQRQRLMQGY